MDFQICTQANVVSSFRQIVAPSAQVIMVSMISPCFHTLQKEVP